MRTIRSLTLLGVVLAIAPAGVSPAADAGRTWLEDGIRASLSGSKVKDRDLAIAALSGDASEPSTRLLSALLDGALYCDKDSGAVFIQENGVFLDLDGKDAGVAAARLKKSAVDNKQRKEIAAILNRRRLSDPDPEKRRTASAALMEIGAPELEREALTALIQAEKDPATAKNLRTALGIRLAKDADGDTETLLRAVEWLSAGGQPPAGLALELLAASPRREVASAAADALYWGKVGRDWTAIAETTFFGLSLGSILVLAAIGLAITFGVMGVINMAHGELIMIGAYVAWGMQRLLPGNSAAALFLSVPAAFLIAGAIGMVMERGIIRFLYSRPLETLLATFGVSLILQQAVRSIFSPLNRAVENPAFMSGMWQIGRSFNVTRGRFYILVFSAGVFFLIYAALRWTRLGLEVRAVSQNRAIARALGVRDARVDALTFGMGSGVAGLAGVALSQITNVGPNLGQAYIVDSFMVVVFGGVGNLWGAMIGGLILGIANKALEPFSGAMLSRIFILVFIILFIQKRPRGLFPQQGRAAES
ncbi:MAG: urea ABC transporter permease subunit UrtB [Planctomycetota bacterium]|jgi:urea transport system permease protein|nr:urea ABC transporter permease subunit UrtB [Planctomycetota bacterium]